jgi:purine-binding chemotaxis protein CheW
MSNQYLTFTLAEEVFALDISSVREVLEYTSITKMPRTPDYIRGVINLRGRAVPVVDVRLKFGLSETQRTVSTCIIIVEVKICGDQTVLGALTDSVREVIDIEPRDIEPAPKMGSSIKTDFIKGIGKQDGTFIILLDIDKVFSEEELAAISMTAGVEESALAV